LSKAVKFTPEGGEIFVALELDGTRVRVIVRHSGIGIASEFLPHLFDPTGRRTTDGRANSLARGSVSPSVASSSSFTAVPSMPQATDSGVARRSRRTCHAMRRPPSILK
jgi:hypothetical protein